MRYMLAMPFNNGCSVAVMASVVTVAGICNSVGSVVFLTCHRSGGAGG